MNAAKQILRSSTMALVALLLCSLPVRAGQNHWTTHGPQGGSISSVVVDPRNSSRVFAGTGAGVFRSTDKANSWETFGEGSPGSIDRLAFDASEPPNLYAIAEKRLFRSSSMDAIWSAIDVPGSTEVSDLALDPRDPATVYVVAGGLYRSTDRGVTWSPAQSGLVAPYYGALVADPVTPGTLYYFVNVHIYKTVDGGGNWTRIDPGLGGIFNSLAVDPRVPTTIYVGGSQFCLFGTCSGGGLITSRDGGAHWSSQLVAGSTDVGPIVVDPSTSAIYAWNTDHSAWWKSTDGGVSWTGTAFTFTEQAGGLAIDPTDPDVVYSGGGFLHKSSNGGRTSVRSDAGIVATSVSSLAADRQVGRTVYAAVEDRLYKSSNAGDSWTELPPIMYRPNRVVLDPRTSETVYVTGGQLLKSHDGGITFQREDLSVFVYRLAIDPSHPDILYAVSDNTLFRKSDSAWAEIGMGVFAQTYVGEIGVDPTDSNRIYVLSSKGLYKSNDGGATWELLGGDFADQWGIFAVDPVEPATIYATTANRQNASRFLKIAKSNDGGVTWREASAGLPEAGVTVIAIDPAVHTRLYAGTGAGIFVSVDSGATWEPFGDGLRNTNISSLDIDASGTRLHAGTYGGGVFDYEIIPPGPCTPSPTDLCLNGSHFRVQADWRVPSQGRSGHGVAVPLTSDTGYFWFFSESNVEVVVKVLDGCTFNSRTWVFSGGLTDVEVTLTVTNTLTGQIRRYVNPAGRAFQPIQDTAAFPATCSTGKAVISPSGEGEQPSRIPPSASLVTARTGSCAPDPAGLCLGAGRFRVEAAWRVPSRGMSGLGMAVPLTEETGYFWFFGANNLEAIVKVVNGCTLNSHHWVFAAGLTNVEVTVTVTDTQTGEIKTYLNPAETAFQPIQDTGAFATCP